jgi:hypothetical protein
LSQWDFDVGGVSAGSDLRTWSDWNTPGHYIVDAEYGLPLSGVERRTGGFLTDSDLANFWNALFAWRADILVQ